MPGVHYWVREVNVVSRAITEEHLGWYDDLNLPEKIVEAAGNPKDTAFMSLQAATGLRPTQAIHLMVRDIDFEKERLSIVCLKEPSRIDCPDCGERLAKKHRFCPVCGNQVARPIRDRIEEQHYRIIPVYRRTLTDIEQYLNWRQRFSYQGPLLFPFSRQRAWQITERVGRRAGLRGLHPETLRNLLAARWVHKGLDVNKLRFLLGYRLSTAGSSLHFSFEELQSEYQKLWETR